MAGYAKGEKPREGFWRASPEEHRLAMQVNDELAGWYGYYTERLPLVLFQPKQESVLDYRIRVRKLGFNVIDGGRNGRPES